MSATVDPTARPAGAERPAEYRYGIVLACTATAVVFLIVAPSADWSRATALALESLALLVAVATSRARAEVRRARAGVVGTVAALLVVGVAVGLVSEGAATALGAAVGIAVPLALVGGLVSLIRRHGVTLQAVAGALAIYLQLGLIFAWVIGFVTHVDSDPYFAQGGDGSPADRVYFSFTVLTTTGFGDLTPAQPVGRALAVVEMLGGQLYLVTVIGVLVGGLVGRRRT
jgi:Ion channel